ncbi:hypothetical protein CFU_2936 [Collimonas fungivorans Ter331]|uniref:Uncharacterized protein n=1 Tax=Collimonas fungivorans (strain Ter331) TaxID=1005048 RepID=G0ACG7_COLFT|nr:hypothetical protein CFU_2936 [Collimonas fungivorans Ter331]
MHFDILLETVFLGDDTLWQEVGQRFYFGAHEVTPKVDKV